MESPHQQNEVENKDAYQDNLKEKKEGRKRGKMEGKKEGRKEWGREKEGRKRGGGRRRKRARIFYYFLGFWPWSWPKLSQHNLGKLLIEFFGKCFLVWLIHIIDSILNLLLHFGGGEVAKEDFWQPSIPLLTSS